MKQKNFLSRWLNRLLPDMAERPFVELGMELACHMQQANRYSTSANYATALRSLQDFRGDCPLFLRDFTPDLMHNYQCWLLNNGKTLNTVSCYARALRAIYNKVYPKLADRGQDVFGRVFTGHTRTDKRAISEDEVRHLQQMDQLESYWLQLSRDMFLFSFYCMGMPFVDIVYLKKTQIQGNRLIYYRRKTGQRICVELEPCAWDIIVRWRQPESEYLFPFINPQSGRSLSQQHQSALTQYNRALRRLSAKSGLKRTLSSYTARHTWASMAYLHQTDIHIIAQALGHTETDTTRIYIKELSDEQLAQANRRILAFL